MDGERMARVVVPSPGPRVVLLRDRRWPEIAGVCCWRHGVHEAFSATGAAVDEAVFDAPKAAQPAGPGRSAPRIGTFGPRATAAET